LALEETLKTKVAHYWSRSRSKLWKKGESSGNLQHIVEVRTDCDQDVVLIRVKPAGAACHTGYPTCFFRKVPLPVDSETPVPLENAGYQKEFDPNVVYKKNA
jgi:phosphoribosyl-AMP cyclohydrolase